jgi:exodeoxyribonuclease V gamma subunit
MLTIAPLGRPAAAALLADLLRAWDEGMATVAPFAAKTALAAVGEPLDRGAAAATFEGGDGERRDFALGRLFPDFEALAADGRFESSVRRLFAPLSRWIAESASIEAHPTASASTEVDG